VRLNLCVRPNGEPILQFLNENGKVVRELVGTAK